MVGATPQSASIPQSAAWAPTLPGAERGTVNGMLPDFRFVLGAILAMSMLAVAGLGLVTSVQLLRQAQMNPLEEQRSLAFAGRAGWNQFYDPDGARRFDGLAGKTEGQVAQARLETPTETAAIAPSVIAPVSPEARTASIPPNRVDPDIVPVLADDKAPEADPAHTDPPQAAETAAVTIAARPEPAIGAQAPEMPAPEIPAPEVPAPEVPGLNGSSAPPAERVASAPAASAGPDLSRDPRTPAQEPAQPRASGDPLPVSAPPIPPARPKAHFRKKVARVHIHSVGAASPQPWQNSGFPATNPPPWPGYDDKSTGATTTKKTTGKLSGTLTNRPQ
jgi:hypothetical protein